MDAAYHRRYRLLHRDRINARSRARRAAACLAQRQARHRAEVVRRARRRAGPLALPYLGHPLFDQARALVGDPWYGATLYDPLREDAMSEVVLAILEGRDPAEALARYMAAERVWRVTTVPLMDAL